MEHNAHSASPLDYASEESSSLTSTDEVPAAKQRTQTFRAITCTLPTRCATFGPENLSNPCRSSSNTDTAEEVEQRDRDKASTSYGDDHGSADDSSKAGSDDGTVDHPNTATLPSLADVGAALSSSIISSHDTSFCNSLLVSQGEALEAERTPSIDPRHTCVHRNPNSPLHSGLPIESVVEHCEGCGHPVSDESDNGATTTTTITATATTTRPHGSVNATVSKPPNREANASTHLPITPQVRLQHLPTSPVSDVRTLRDLLAWRSHLSGSQYSLELHQDDNNDDGRHASPTSKSAPPHPLVRDANHDGTVATDTQTEFPASSPVTPGLWRPTLPVGQPYFRTPPSLPSPLDPVTASAMSATAEPISRHASGDDVAHQRSGASPLSIRPSRPPRLASNRFTSSELDDSFSSACTSHITSPAMAVPPHHAVSSPSESRTRLEREHCGCGDGATHHRSYDLPHSNISSPVLVTPLTARRAVVQDTRQASQNAGASANLITVSSRSSDAKEEPVNSPASKVCPGGGLRGSSSSTSLHGGWGIEDHAPPRARGAGFSNLPALSPARYNLASRGSDASTTSPRSALAGYYSPSPSQDYVHGSPISFSHPSRAGEWDSSAYTSRADTDALLHRTTSSAVSTPPPLHSTVSHQAAKVWRGLKAPEEYPAFATPVDDDTNKEVVAFVTALLLVFCLGFIFAF
jgi:hypothetical protein